MGRPTVLLSRGGARAQVMDLYKMDLTGGSGMHVRVKKQLSHGHRMGPNTGDNLVRRPGDYLLTFIDWLKGLTLRLPALTLSSEHVDTTVTETMDTQY